jgi:hypothetical protein
MESEGAARILSICGNVESPIILMQFERRQKHMLVTIRKIMATWD